MKRILFATLVVPILAFGVISAGDKKPTLPADAYKVLVERSIKTIEEIAKAGGENAAARIDAEALILAGYTFSIKDAPGKLRDKALFAAVKARANEIKDLADFGKLADAES